MRSDYEVIFADGRKVEVCGVSNRDRGSKRFHEGARGHAIFIANEAGYEGSVVGVNKLPHDSNRYRERMREAKRQIADASRHKTALSVTL